MARRAVCPLCRASYHLPDGYQGKRVRCVRCQELFWVAAAAAPAGEQVIDAELVEDAIAATVVAPEAVRGTSRRSTPNRLRRPTGTNRRVGPLVAALAVAGGGVTLLLVASIVGLAVFLAGSDSPSPAAVGSGDPPPELLAATALPARVLHDVKDATVFVKVDAGEEAGSGSGFVIKAEGTTGYVVTNHHVITPPPDDAAGPGGGFRRRRGPFPGPPFRPAARPVLTLVFRSGTPQERSAPASVLVDDAVRDLAVLQVTGVSGLPAPVALVRHPQLAETLPVFVFGYPFGDALGLDNANPAVTVGKGSVSSLRRDARGEVARIQIDGDLNPGNSGGPVVDGQGRLVGIAVAKVRNTQIGLAIPPDELIALLESAARR